MKSTNYFIVTILIGLLNTTVFGQQPTQATIGSINKLTPMFGFNTNGHMPANFPNSSYIGANWTQQEFVDSTIYLYPEILRFPGGINSNHWDWQTGWFFPAFMPPPPSVPMTLRTDEFKPALQGCNGQGLFVLNLESSDAHYEMDGMRHADSLGLNPYLFELGNEHNLEGLPQHPNQEMTPYNYAILAKEYYDSIKIVFPISKVCVVAGNSQTGTNMGWNDTILNHIPTIEAFAFHVYKTADNADMVFNVNRSLAVAMGDQFYNLSTAFQYFNSGMSSSSLSSSSLPVDKEVWVTEFNMQENLFGATPIIAKTWTHALYVTGMNHFFLNQDNITMIINHSLASANDYHQTISKLDHHITANGVAMKLLYDMSRGSSTCESMDFSGNPSITYGPTTFPKLIGWKFNYPTTEKGFICNFSADTFKVSLSSVFTHNMLYDQYFADTALVVSGMSSLNKFSGSSLDSITIYPFSMTQITASLGLGTNEIEISGSNELWIYPNPSVDQVTVKTSQSMNNASIIIYSLSGQEVKSYQGITGNSFQIQISELQSGNYLIVIQDENQFVSGKLLVE